MLPFFYTFYRFLRGAWAAIKDPEYEALAALTGIILASGTIFYHGTEGWGWLDSLYFSVITLTTVGYGDLTPHTAAGKIFTMAYLFVGIGVLLSFINAVARHTIQEGQEKGLFFPKGGFGGFPFVGSKGDDKTP